MKIVIISDTHRWSMPLERLPEADILIHAGDATSRGSISEVNEFALDISKHLQDSTYKKGYKKIIFIPGNHDFLFETDQSMAVQIMNDYGVDVLINESVVVEGIKIWGSPVTPPFFDWAFNWNSEKRKLLWETIPEDTDIVVTHGPPKFILDRVIRGENVGCLHLADRIDKIKPKLHIFGHIHESYGIVEIDGVKYINAAIRDHKYRVENEPIVEEL